MCDVHAFVRKDSGEEKVMENVEYIEAQGDVLILKNIYGQEKNLKARFVLLDNDAGKVVLQPLG
jgi:predicted RNA-binding protein